MVEPHWISSLPHLQWWKTKDPRLKPNYLWNVTFSSQLSSVAPRQETLGTSQELVNNSKDLHEFMQEEIATCFDLSAADLETGPFFGGAMHVPFLHHQTSEQVTCRNLIWL